MTILRLYRVFLATVFFTLLVPLAFAAEFLPGGIDGPGCEKIDRETFCVGLALVGRIDIGDAKRLAERIGQIETSFGKQSTARLGLLKLDSPGGNVAEAILIGKLVRTRQIATFVTSDAACASSCVLVLAGGVRRIAFGPVAIHSFYSPDLLGTGNFAQSNAKYDEVARTIEDYLRTMRVSRSLLDAMMKIPHDNVKELSLQELDAFGLVGIDPSYAQARKINK
jgi:hypothetical protein